VLAVLRLSADAYVQMIGLAYDGLPEEACGLLVGDPRTSQAPVFVPCRNAAESSKLYSIDGRDYLRADRLAGDAGLEIIGVMHSHTHTDAYPSPTDVAQAPDPGWHYVIVSLRDTAPVLRSYRIEDGAISEEPVTIEDVRRGGQSVES
jgi:proteasome lid subunit RPN8/RPN11